MIDTDAQLAYGIFWAAYAIAFVVFFYMMKSLVRFLPFYGMRTLILAALVALLLTRLNRRIWPVGGFRPGCLAVTK